jgi:hypothetical protein
MMKNLYKLFVFILISCQAQVIEPIPDVFYFNTAGVPQGGATYNVLTNDIRNLCDPNIDSVTTTPLLIDSISLTGTATTPFPYFTILSDGSISVDIFAGNGFSIPTGSYTLTYTVCDGTFTAVCATKTVNIYVNTQRVSTEKPLAAKKINSTNTTTYQIINFTDVNLKAKLLEANTTNNIAHGLDNVTILAIDTNNDGEIDTNEALQIGRLTLYNAGITNLSGLEYFTNLKRLGAPINNISNFTLTSLNFERIDLWDNPNLSSIDVSNFPNLTRLFINNTSISSLNVSNNPNLWVLGIVGTPITTINLQNNSLLELFYCSNSIHLTYINIKNNSMLDYNNSFMQQDCWVNCPNLTTICADSNEIPALQSFLTSCGVSTSGITIDATCALASDDFFTETIQIHPNPVTSVLYVGFSEALSEKANATLYDIVGKKIFEKEIAIGSEHTAIPFENYQKGVYLLQLQIGYERKTKKVVKE